MKKLFDSLSEKCSEITTKKYSTSFSLGVLFLNKKLHNPIYSIYGYVRLADEIVDSFHGFNKSLLLDQLKKQTYEAIDTKISINPLINSFQAVVNQFGITSEMIDAFLNSMEMDLEKKTYSEAEYQKYIYGSAEVVGLMCLKVFTSNDSTLFESLKPAALRLGAAFQKVNFLRDVKDDNLALGRTYFPKVDLTLFSEKNKKEIEQEIENDFRIALTGILKLPPSSKNGVFLAYYYYYKLFEKIKHLTPQRILEKRIRISNPEKYYLLLKSTIKLKLSGF